MLLALLLSNIFSALAQHSNLENSLLNVCVPQFGDVFLGGGMKNRVFSNGEDIACRYGYIGKKPPSTLFYFHY